MRNFEEGQFLYVSIISDSGENHARDSSADEKKNTAGAVGVGVSFVL